MSGGSRPDVRSTQSRLDCGSSTRMTHARMRALMRRLLRSSSALFNGSVIGLPVSSQVRFMQFRRDALERAGLAPPNTWQELLDVARALNGTDFNNGACAAPLGSFGCAPAIPRWCGLGRLLGGGGSSCMHMVVARAQTAWATLRCVWSSTTAT